MHDDGVTAGRLESWKQIAAYLNKSERTVRRWHELEGLPVHKHHHLQKGTVWAYPNELQEWLAGRTLKLETPVPSAPPSRWPWLMAAGLALSGSIFVLLMKPEPRNLKTDATPVTTLPGSEYGPSMSPDGKKVAFYWGQPGRTENGIYVKEIGSTAVTPLAVAPPRTGFRYSPAWSPDGTTIAFLERSAQGTWLNLVPSAGGDPRKLRQIATAPALYFANQSHISWSRDSKWLIVPMAVESQHGIYRVSADNGSTVALTKDTSVYAPSLSPDGRRLVSLRHEGLPIQSEEILVHELNADGGISRGPTVVHKGRSASAGITWMADSRNLVLCRSESVMLGALSLLYRLPPVADAGMDEIGGAGCSTVTTAPDGSLVYGASSTARSKLVRAKIHPPQPITEFLASSRFDAFPSFSPDGKQIAFNSNRSGKPEIWVATEDGGSAHRVAPGVQAFSGAEWSPNGDRLVYVTGSSLVVSDLAGGKPKQIGLDGVVAEHAVWSGDGGAILYTAQSHLWRVRLDGSQRERLRELPPVLELHAGPEGKYLYYLKPGKPFTLCRIAIDGGPEETLQEAVFLPGFAVNRQALYWVPSGLELHTQSLSAGSAPQSLGRAIPPYALNSWDTRFTVSPDGNTAVWVVAAPQEVDLAMQTVRSGR